MVSSGKNKWKWMKSLKQPVEEMFTEEVSRPLDKCLRIPPSKSYRYEAKKTAQAKF